jgi:hypothetical protein
LTTLLEKLMAEATIQAVKYTKPREVSDQRGLRLAVTPQTALSLRTDPALAAELLQLDALQTEVLMENIARTLSPWLTGKQLSAVVSAAPGVLVVEAPASSPVLAGDLIETISGQPALPHVLSRMRFRGAPVEARVRRRDGSTAEIVLR